MPRWDPGDYARNSQAQATWAGELIAKLGLGGDETILDIGCGDGKITARLAELVPGGAVVGLDSSADMIAFARSEFPPDLRPNLSFVVGDASALDLEQHFDVVFSNAALHWIIDHHPVLKGIRRCLRPGGRVLLQMGGTGNAAQIVEVVEEIIREDQWKQYFHGFSFPYGFHGPEEYEAWAGEAGLKEVRAKLIPKTMLQNDAEGFAGWLRTTWMPYLQRVPEQRRDELVQKIVARYMAAYPPDSQGNIVTPMMRLEVAAKG